MAHNAVDIAYSDFVARRTELAQLSPDANEATTRLRSIDTLLFEVLDWEKEEVEAEKYCRVEGYADYVCTVDDLCRRSQHTLPRGSTSQLHPLPSPSQALRRAACR